MAPSLTTRQKFVLAALAACPDASFAPVQVQKLFFLIDQNLGATIGGKQFAFTPYDYGPFDKAVYRELDQLSAVDHVSIDRVSESAGGRRYSVTSLGRQIGQEHLAGLPKPAVAYLVDVSKWVRGLSFAELVGAIYRAYPEMRKNSIFVD